MFSVNPGVSIAGQTVPYTRMFFLSANNSAFLPNFMNSHLEIDLASFQSASPLCAILLYNSLISANTAMDVGMFVTSSFSSAGSAYNQYFAIELSAAQQSSSSPSCSFVQITLQSSGGALLDLDVTFNVGFGSPTSLACPTSGAGVPCLSSRVRESQNEFILNDRT